MGHTNFKNLPTGLLHNAVACILIDFCKMLWNRIVNALFTAFSTIFFTFGLLFDLKCSTGLSWFNQKQCKNPEVRCIWLRIINSANFYCTGSTHLSASIFLLNIQNKSDLFSSYLMFYLDMLLILWKNFLWIFCKTCWADGQ